MPIPSACQPIQNEIDAHRQPAPIEASTWPDGGTPVLCMSGSGAWSRR
jgi:hypothetical protein